MKYGTFKYGHHATFGSREERRGDTRQVIYRPVSVAGDILQVVFVLVAVIGDTEQVVYVPLVVRGDVQLVDKTFRPAHEPVVDWFIPALPGQQTEWHRPVPAVGDVWGAVASAGVTEWTKKDGSSTPWGREGP